MKTLKKKLVLMPHLVNVNGIYNQYLCYCKSTRFAKTKTRIRKKRLKEKGSEKEVKKYS